MKDDAEVLLRKEKIIKVVESEEGSYIDTKDMMYHVKEKPHTIFARLQEPDAIITPDGRVYK